MNVIASFGHDKRRTAVRLYVPKNLSKKHVPWQFCKILSNRQLYFSYIEEKGRKQRKLMVIGRQLNVNYVRTKK